MEKFPLTPVEKRGEYYFKREDLYVPFDFSPANGSKLRQCQILIKKNIDKYKGIITGTSIYSPQAVIVATVAKGMGFPCWIYYGGTTKEKLYQNKYANLCRHLGANVDIVSKMAYTSVLSSKAQLFADEFNLYNVRYGFDLIDNLDVFVHSTARQVENIPDNINSIVITVGSAITLIGLLYGIVLYNKNIQTIYAIGCAPNRIAKIEKYAHEIYFETGISLPLEKITYIDAFNTLRGFKYENTKKEEYCGITFHPRYEAKTFSWLKDKNLGENTLMWITGSDFVY